MERKDPIYIELLSSTDIEIEINIIINFENFREELYVEILELESIKRYVNKFYNGQSSMLFSNIHPRSNRIKYSFNFNHKTREIIILTHPESITITLNENTSGLFVEKLAKLLKDKKTKI